MSSPKNERRSKAVLKAITYKGIEYPTPELVEIDITDTLLLKGINGISSIVGLSTEAEPDGPVWSRFVVDDVELDGIRDRIFEIVDASIVNSKQSEAIKKLVGGVISDFRRKHWDELSGKFPF